ncbi:TlyA family RNA methyltransferase [bacterium]|nr:TlyA family RNA methyltransferase [bacterium]
MMTQGNPEDRYVSRGGLKLAAALKAWAIPVDGRVCLDVGAGSGGFTQVMLEQNPARLYAVDVGYGQFEWKLRGDPRLVLLERKNARFLTKEDIPDPVDFFSVDVSFISIFKIFPAILPLLSPAAEGVILFKPNFEARREEVQKGGILSDPAVHRRLLLEASQKFPSAGLTFAELMPSPIRGSGGNVEYLLWLKKGSDAPPVETDRISSTVTTAFQN